MPYIIYSIFKIGIQVENKVEIYKNSDINVIIPNFTVLLFVLFDGV